MVLVGGRDIDIARYLATYFAMKVLRLGSTVLIGRGGFRSAWEDQQTFWASFSPSPYLPGLKPRLR